MTVTHLTWAVLGLLYAAFTGWYTACGGPLTPQEVEHYLGLMAERRGASPERLALLRDFMESDTGDDLVMLNVIEMYETPLQIDGVEPGESSSEVLAKYMEYMTPALLSRACHPVFYGEAAALALEMFGVEGVREWTVGAGMRYRSRRDLMEIATNPAFEGRHAFKVAAMKKTFAFPVDPWFQLGDPRIVLALLFAAIGSSVGWLRARRA